MPNPITIILLSLAIVGLFSTAFVRVRNKKSKHHIERIEGDIEQLKQSISDVEQAKDAISRWKEKH